MCSNCGKPGHFFRECTEPITSLGVLMFRRKIEGTQILLIRRKDSLGYIEIMRGKYSLEDDTAIQDLIDQATVDERQRLITTSFSQLWKLLWNGQVSRRYQIEFDQAKAKMDTLKESGKLEALITKSTTCWTEAEWGFPKGRRNSSETELVCAFRETFEETGVKRQHLTLVDAEPLVEEFIGSNGIRYKHKYWLAEMSSHIEVIMDPQNKEQAKEIGDVRWVTLDDAKKLIRPYNTEKLAVLEHAMCAIALNLSC